MIKLTEALAVGLAAVTARCTVASERHHDRHTTNYQDQLHREETKMAEPGPRSRSMARSLSLSGQALDHLSVVCVSPGSTSHHEGTSLIPPGHQSALILGAGQLDRTVSDADVLLGQHPAEDGLRYLNLQPGTYPNHLSPEDLAVTILINSAGGRPRLGVHKITATRSTSGNCVMCRWRRRLLVNAPRSPVSSPQSRTGRDLQPHWQLRFSTRNGPS